MGSDPPWVGDGRLVNNKFNDNVITGTSMGVSVKNSDGFSITG